MQISINIGDRNKAKHSSPWQVKYAYAVSKEPIIKPNMMPKIYGIATVPKKAMYNSKTAKIGSPTISSKKIMTSIACIILAPNINSFRFTQRLVKSPASEAQPECIFLVMRSLPERDIVDINKLLAQAEKSGETDKNTIGMILGNRIDMGSEHGGLISIRNFDVLADDILLWASKRKVCNCRQCLQDRADTEYARSFMIVCSICGNKRCPHATDHRHECTNSNEPGQSGSIYA